MMSRFRFERVSDNHLRSVSRDTLLPKKATKHSCAYDFFANDDVTIQPFSVTPVWTDCRVRMPHGYMLMLNVRSSMGKHPIMLSNTQGWIDADYYRNPDNDGNICLMFYNIGPHAVSYKRGDRIAQGMFVRHYGPRTARSSKTRTGGLGSTGS